MSIKQLEGKSGCHRRVFIDTFSCPTRNALMIKTLTDFHPPCLLYYRLEFPLPTFKANFSMCDNETDKSVPHPVGRQGDLENESRRENEVKTLSRELH